MRKLASYCATYFTILLVIAFAPLGSALGAQLPNSTIEPGQVQKRLEDIPQVPISQPEAEQPPVPVHQPGANDDISFTLKSIVIDDVTAYKPEELAPLYADYIDKPITLKDAYAIIDKITAKYRADGYVLSHAILPPQEIDQNATLHLKVIEGYIEHVTFQGSYKDSTRQLLKAYGHRIEQTRPIKLETMERYLTLMNDLPGVTATSVIHPSTTVEGVADLDITADKKAFDLAASLDNRGTIYMGPLEGNVSAAANGVLGLDEKLSVRVVGASPLRELRFYDFQNEQQLDDDGTKLILEYSHSRNQPGDILRVLDVIGSADLYGGKITHPFIRSRAENLTSRFGFDWRDTNTDVLGQRFNFDRTRVFHFGGAYDIADDLGGKNLFDLEVSQGVDFLGATDRGVDRSRVFGRDNFTKITGNITRIQDIWGGFSASISFDGQWANVPLLASEQFSLGGQQFGSAYDSSELTGDEGFAGRAELRYNENIGYEMLSAAQLYGFYDGGVVWSKQVPVGSEDRASLTSAGVGVRASFTPWLSGNLELAYPLTKPIDAEGDHRGRVFFGMTTTY